MMNFKRGGRDGRGICLAVTAALGIALSGCGGGQSSSTAASTAVQSSSPTASTTASSSSATTPTTAPPGSSTTKPAQGSTGANGAPSGSDPPTASVDTVTLKWAPPTENVDGTPLTNLAGYNIHYGTASGHLTKTIAISNPGIATYVVSNLAPGTYYFAVAAVNSAGTESPLSSQVSTTVN